MAECGPPVLGNHGPIRRQVLIHLGASETCLEELLDYNQNRVVEEGTISVPPLPLSDEAHVDAWQSYAEEAADRGAWEVLRERIVQLRFPIAEGISAAESYRQATRRGIEPEEADVHPGLELEDPGRLELQLHPSPGGRVPILVTDRRQDFVALVRAFAGRNEPIPVPESMGACMVSGFNNWDRIRTYRKAWQGGSPERCSEAAWRAEFQRLTPKRHLYQDRLVLLSQGPYSNVAAGDVGFDEAEWLARSLVIRREHECTHYLSLRLFGRLQHNLLEELVADLVGLLGAFGVFRSDLALRFLGLEALPAYRKGGRLENYRGSPPLSDDAFAVLGRLAGAAVANLADLASNHAAELGDTAGLARLVAALTSLTLEELASTECGARAEQRLAELVRDRCPDHS